MTIPKLSLRSRLLAALLLSWSSALAQEPPAAPPSALAAPAPAIFLLERITIEGLKNETARGIVRAESRLTEGRSYSEPELRDAVFRVRRLPFVVDADLALGRGSARGAYVLTITVEAAKPVAYSLDVFGFGHDGEFSDDRFDAYASGTLSARKFLGSTGVLFGSVQGFDDTDAGHVLQLGYTRYGLLRPGGFVTVAASTGVGGTFDDEDLQTSLQAGLPLVGNHALRAGAAYSRVDFDRSTLGVASDSRFEEWSAQLLWIYDSTDHPLVPLAGRRVSAAFGRFESRQRLTRPDDGREVSIEGGGWIVRSEGRQYWPLTPRQSMGAGLAFGYTDRDSDAGFEQTAQFGVAEVIHTVSIFDSAAGSRGELRLETSLGVEHFEEKVRTSFFAGDEDDTQALLRASLTFRHGWGLLRLSLIYVDELGESR